MSFSKMDIPKKIMLLGMSYADAIKKKLDNNTDVNATDVIMTEDMGITLTKIIMIDCSVDCSVDVLRLFLHKSPIRSLKPSRLTQP